MNKAIFAAAATLLGATALAAQTPPPAHTIWDGVFTAAQATAGKAVFEAKCVTCHGEELMGQEMAPPLTGPSFFGNWNGLSLGDLAVRIQTTMPANDPGSLKAEEVTEVIAYILSYNKFPEGAAALPSDQAGLGQIAIAATKPADK